MSLIPVLLSRLGATRSAAPGFAMPSGYAAAVASSGYRPDNRHRPLALILATGLPAALIAAYTLTPQRYIPDIKPPTTSVTSIKVEPLPPPPPEPEITEKTPPQSVITAPRPPFTPPKSNDAEVALADPLVIQPKGPVMAELPPQPDIIIPPMPPVPPVKVPARLDDRYAASFQPDYPLRELRGSIEGKARVRVLVGGDGRVKAVEDAGSTAPNFFTETRKQALAKWRFKPATSDGTPVDSWFTITVRFELNTA